VNLGASLYRRGLFDTVGLLDESLRFSEDLDFLMRCWEKDVRKALVDEVTLHYRRHPNSMTAGVKGDGFDTVQVVNRRIERARRGVYNPKQPRHLPAIDYIGVGPTSQDDTAAGDGSPFVQGGFGQLLKEYAIWNYYRREVLRSSYLRFLAMRWGAHSAWHVPFIGAKRAFQKMVDVRQ
jgi:hypothetical protein